MEQPAAEKPAAAEVVKIDERGNKYISDADGNEQLILDFEAEK